MKNPERKYTIGNSIVVVRIGSILDSKTNVYVSSDDDHFTMAGGVPLAIRQAAGDGVYNELRSKAGNYPVGNVTVTSAGTLTDPVHIFHGISRRFGESPGSRSSAEVKEIITSIVTKSLELLETLGLSSIAFPAIGTGFAGFGPKDVALYMARAVTERLHESKREIRAEIVLYPKDFERDVDFTDFFRHFDDASGLLKHAVRDHAVVFVHGIRTEAVWFDVARKIFREYDSSLNPVTAGYEFFDLIRFLVPLEWAKRSAYRRVESKILTAARHPGTARVSIIAHSFGTYLVGQVLENNPDLRLHRLILCGAVLSQKYRWEAVSSQLTPIDPVEYPTQCVVNDCGWRDVWPVLAQASTWGYGSSGRFGFQTPEVVDRYHDRSHGQFFDKEFVTKYWCSVISSGIVNETFEERPAANWMTRVATIIKIPYLVFALGATALLLA